MAIQSEVRQFVELIHAKQKKLEGYNGNLFIKNDTILIIKISRTDKVFYGVNGNIIYLLIYSMQEKNIYFGIVLLDNKQRGYFYPGNIIFNKIQKNIWRKANDGDYKINPPLRDALYFKSHKEFEKIFKICSNV